MQSQALTWYGNLTQTGKVSGQGTSALKLLAGTQAPVMLHTGAEFAFVSARSARILALCRSKR